MRKFINLELEIEKSKILLRLANNKGDIDFLVWKDNNSLSRFLLEKINQLLRKNNIGLDKISGYKIIRDVSETWTSIRVAKITLESLMLAKKNRLC
jgi:hypothetical protein